MIPSMDHQPSNSSAMDDVPSLSPSPPPPPPSLRRRHVKRCSPREEETDEEENKPKKRSKKLPQRPPTERVLRPRSRDSRHEEEEEEEGEEEKAELRVSLSQKEIEEDFVRLTGSKPPRRPKQRCKTRAQIRLKRLFPGLGLPRTITSDAYTVKETD
ncbi:hypothetical protein MUK42_35255 [Musa troglodytarum]|uniref:Uncharacterized protein n=1 Tax=Musa troglodytarum TaxID=320322 RepID=A0A9E7EDT5_9LILI|nr:hypothetical protein MUK42_35255 [Musa troglodytarum]